MAADVERVLVPLGLVLVLETIAAKRTLVLLLSFMLPIKLLESPVAFGLP